jgi:hypothetical protein
LISPLYDGLYIFWNIKIVAIPIIESTIKFWMAPAAQVYS